MKKSVFLGKGRTILFIVAIMLGVMLNAGRMEVSAAENDANGNTIERSMPKGEGTEASPYQIGTAEELYWFAALVNDDEAGNASAHAVLTNNITVNTGVLDENGELASDDTSKYLKWTPIGTEDNAFIGTFNGQDHVINGLYFNDDQAENVGLFGYVITEGSVVNVGVKDSYFKGKEKVGGICGYNNGKGIIKNCYNIGTVSGSKDIGGICGDSRGTCENCYNIGAVSGADCVGGICGFSNNSIKSCYNTGTVSDVLDNGIRVGGVCGSANTIENCYNEGAVSCLEIVGGVCGNADTIKNCYNTGTVSGSQMVGGICGNASTIKNCYNTGAVNGSKYVGGVCGYYNSDGTNANCYYDSTVYNGNDTNAEGKTIDEFESGEVAWLLQDGQENKEELVWGQTLAGENKQLSPVLGGEKVYKVDRYLGCIDAPGEKTVGYSNTEGDTIYEPHRYENGICSFCQKAYQEAVLTTDKYDIDGDDTPEDVYEISNAGQLYWFAGLVNGTLKDEEQNTSANAVLTENITVNTSVLDKDGNLVKDTSKFINWTPIGSNANPFAGTFDGKKYTISGLYFDDSNESYCGLFGFVGTGGKVVGTGVLDSYLKGDVHVGGICGRNESIIENCYYSGVVVGSMYVGGICGISDNDENCTIKNCYNTGTAVGSDNSSDNFVGGVCGYNENGIIENCYNIGDVSGSYAGGVCGNSGNSENSGNTVKNCYNTGAVSGSSESGGVCGSNIKGTIENCYNTGTVSYLEFVGGICGTETSSTIVNCYYNNSVYKGNAIGFSNGTVKNVEGKTTEQFQSGEVAYLLQASQKDQTELVWGQKLIGENPQVSPVLGGDRVYKVKRYPGCEAVPGNPTDEYSNSEEEIFEPHKDDGSQGGTAYDNRCDFCGKELHSFNEDGSCKDAGCAYHKGSITNVSCPTKIVYSGDVANAEPKAGDFTVASGKEPVFTWYQGDVTNGNLSTDSLGATTPKETGIYTLVVKADGAEKGGIVYTVAELRVKVTIEKEQVKEQPTTPQPSDTTVAQPPKNGDVIADDKTKAKFEVTDVTKKEVTYHAPITIKAKTITIPATIKINGEIYKVTKIDKNALKGNKKVTKIVVGSNIQSIGDYAFSGCKKLKTIIIQSKKLTTKTVSKKAFKGIAKKVVVKVPKKKRTAYKKLLKKKGLSSKNRIKNY